MKKLNKEQIIKEFVEDYKEEINVESIKSIENLKESEIISDKFFEFSELKTNPLTNEELKEWYYNNFEEFNKFIIYNAETLDPIKNLYEMIKQAISFTIENILFENEENIYLQLR